MHKTSKIYIAGHRGLTGSAIVENLKLQGFTNLVFKTHQELDLINQDAVQNFFMKEKPEYVFLCAAKVGGILANNTYRADFIYENLMIQNNVIHNAYLNEVKKLLFLGTACIYPRNCVQPIKEDYLLTDILEYTNEPYAVAKIAGLKMCESYNLQYGTNFLSVMPASLYGINDNFDLEKSHVMPALIRKFHLAKLLNENKIDDILKTLKIDNINQAIEYLNSFGITKDNVEIWGTGNARREFLHADDMANACIYIMKNIDFKDLYDNTEREIRNTHINIGSGKDIAIKDLVCIVNNIIGFKGEIIYNKNKPEGTFQKLGSCDKIHSLGWKHKIELEEGIRMMYDWYLKQENIRS
ncbi:GDP-L-fucose synthase [Campylobacter insulaenigrae]|uniref:GDP-L-fucose synthase family protein n=1 Tax=Campylobacter insulaenigrae TaxID=260714 RepID=UPI002152114A|nr:GDP-L-fucose synthase [Campylobacter insulaenigrae]MCR6575361.1 GDP-L-fucose synthase [Campylobacter insulaenigrae]